MEEKGPNQIRAEGAVCSNAVHRKVGSFERSYNILIYSAKDTYDIDLTSSLQLHRQ